MYVPSSSRGQIDACARRETRREAEEEEEEDTSKETDERKGLRMV